MLDFQPHVAIVDLELPDADGCEIAKAMRARERRPILIALTGSGDPRDRARAARAGFDLFLVKPHNLDDLLVFLDGLSKVAARRGA
jgi:DNA-binding response OmpR family regulator